MRAPGLRSLAAWLAAGALALYCLARFRGALLTFFWLDDFWVMRDAARTQIDSAWDLGQFLRFSHVGFLMYRPLSTTAYAYLLHALFGYDSSPYHCFQVGILALNAALAFDIARRLTDSRAAGLAVGLIYVLAPGQAVNAYWLSAFTVLGTAVWMLLMMWTWLVAAGSRWRAILAATLQVIGLLASEHAVAGPVLLVALSLARREPARRVARHVAPVAVPVAVYAIAKLWYLAFVRPPAAAYQVSLDPLSVLQQLGRYFTACFNVLTLPSPTDALCGVLGAAVLALWGTSAWLTYRGRDPWRLVAVGCTLFTASLAPVLALRAHFYSHYICLAAFGAALLVVALCRLASVHWRPLAVALSLLLLVFDLATGERAWRQDKILKLVVKGSEISAAWVEKIQEAVRAGNDTVLVPRDISTGSIFAIGEVQTYFPEMPRQVRRVSLAQPVPPWPGRTVVTNAEVRSSTAPLDLANPAPGWEPRWDWLRRLAAE